MKRLKIVWTPFSSWCLEEIHVYIYKQSFSIKIADKQLQQIITRVDQLQAFPESGQEEPFLKAVGQNSRYLVEGNYKIIYQYNKQSIIITDVFHVKQSPKKIIKAK